MPTYAAGEMAYTAGSGLAESEVTMIRSLYAAVQQRCWSRDRSRRIAAMLERERAIAMEDLDRLEAMACQLAEIRALPEALDPQR
jgi:hypothetical protein